MKTISIRGASGLNALNGSDGIIECSIGGNDLSASMGKNGSNAEFTLTRGTFGPASIKVIGTINGDKFEVEVYVKDGFLDIDAQGGNGGDGGRGGQGGRGKEGIKGRNADAMLLGTNGGQGGYGGNGGNGSNGADGGDGGFVKITVSEKDMDLLILIGSVKVNGGKGGSKGLNGKGGLGGPGGKGGDPYSWTSSSTSSSTDHDGNSTSTTEYTTYTNKGGEQGY